MKKIIPDNTIFTIDSFYLNTDKTYYLIKIKNENPFFDQYINCKNTTFSINKFIKKINLVDSSITCISDLVGKTYLFTVHKFNNYFQFFPKELIKNKTTIKE
jgi:hypothetical protein